MGERQTVKCYTCSTVSEFTQSNVRGDDMFCISCGETIANVKRLTQERVDVLRCMPFGGLVDYEVK